MKYIIGCLFLITFSIWISVSSLDTNLQIIACDVGQGDAILIQKKSTQILIDGGPDNSVLSCLGRHMPFWDRSIEMVILTHPDIDHYGGLIDVFKNYKIKKYITNGDRSSSESYKVLENLVGGSGVSSVLLHAPMSVRFDLIWLDTVWPQQKVQDLKNQKFETRDNNNSIVLLLNYGQFKALFTGDVETEVSDQLSENNKVQNSEYIKVNHHGSKNGLSQKLLDVIKPKVAVISVGKKNRYGHPHAEILKILNDKDVKTLRTDFAGDIVIVTDGKTFW